MFKSIKVKQTLSYFHANLIKHKHRLTTFLTLFAQKFLINTSCLQTHINSKDKNSKTILLKQALKCNQKHVSSKLGGNYVSIRRGCKLATNSIIIARAKTQIIIE